ncbi:MAG: cupredoxin domain-containing protein [Gammaproteobacteria bacterium]|nr:cupredoxin domain-containing protein [Gammaproteobacteria bacterium]NIR84825.1 cupredoxin domain-containing protein [Gammaproteobacteria bacterium]NIR91539.1 cupredoxin domain-containing protein [Gammaproteobacteria bacterium]NIU05872.1 cupredoxin domain-containing protein [Gammaproteobacteria bacterium]NIV76727.1 quinol oxidase [Gammaproteobacteria bacterium]
MSVVGLACAAKKCGLGIRIGLCVVALTAWAGVPSAARAQQPQALTVVLADYRFDPDTIEVVAGRPVVLTLVNEDWLTPHNLTLRGGGLDIEVDVSGGTTTTITFVPRSPGTYTFYCDKKLLFLESHRDKGMEGTLVVEAATSSQ